MAYRLEVDQDQCMSSGKCVADFPDTFRFDEEELAVLTDEADNASDEVKLNSARQCPSGAIVVFDGDGKRVHV